MIVFAEDSVDDAFLLKRAFRKLDGTVVIEHVKDGQAVIELLSSLKGVRNGERIPKLLLLDLKMPGTNGFDVLKWRRNNPGWLLVPAIVFSSSAEESDIAKAYELGGNSYAVKPSTLEGYRLFAQALSLWWLNHNRCVGSSPKDAFSSARGY